MVADEPENALLRSPSAKRQRDGRALLLFSFSHQILPATGRGLLVNVFPSYSPFTQNSVPTLIQRVLDLPDEGLEWSGHIVGS